MIRETLQKPGSASIEVGGPSSISNLNEGNFNSSAQTKGKPALTDVVAISKLERLMEGKTFSKYVLCYRVCTLIAVRMMFDVNLLPSYSHVSVITFFLTGCLSFLAAQLSFLYSSVNIIFR